MPQNVIAKLSHTNALVRIRARLLDAQRSMIGETVEDVASKLLCSRFHGAAVGDGVLAIRAGRGDENNHNNLEKMSFQ
jgi:hypothetical protein